MKFSEKLFTLRRQNGLSQDDLAIKLDISRQAVYKWENEQSKPEIDKLKTLSTIFNVSIDNLLDDDADIVFLTTQNKKSYGQVTILDTPKSNLAEVDPSNLTANEIKEAKKFSIIKNVSLIVMLVSIASLIGCIFSLGGDVDAVTWFIWLVLSILIIPTSFKIYKTYKDFSSLNVSVIDTPNYTNTIIEKAKLYFNQRSYEFKALIDDYPIWLFYDLISGNKFGFYFNETEQFICPIQNYVTFIVEKPSSAKDSLVKYTLKYLDENGDVQSYAFSLSLVLIDPVSKKKDVGNRVFRLGSALKLGKEIKSYLDAKKNSIY